MSATKEISIPAPWGHIAAKAWGSPEKPKLLAIHGLNDNAGSFDQLMPLLQDQLCVVCVDLPGHGLSSHFPPGIHFSLLDLAGAIRLVVEHLRWSRLDVIAHSMGGSVAVYYTALFGDNVTNLILIDAFFPIVIPEEHFVQERCQIMLKKFSKPVENSGTVYDYEGSITKLAEERIKSVGYRELKALQKRAFTKCEKGYVLNNDKRMKFVAHSLFTSGFHNGLLKGLQCRLLVILTSWYEGLISQIPTNQRSLSTLRQTLGSKMKTIRVKDSHDVHMENPKVIAPIITQFLFHSFSHL